MNRSIRHRVRFHLHTSFRGALLEGLTSLREEDSGQTDYWMAIREATSALQQGRPQSSLADMCVWMDRVEGVLIYFCFVKQTLLTVYFIHVLRGALQSVWMEKQLELHFGVKVKVAPMIFYYHCSFYLYYNVLICHFYTFQRICELCHLSSLPHCGRVLK